MVNARLEGLVDILMNTESERSELRHCRQYGTPHFWYEAVGKTSGPLSDDEQDKIVEAKKSDPPAADEVFPNLLIGNKAAAEDAGFLASKKITHVINLASASKSKFSVNPDKASLLRKDIALTTHSWIENETFSSSFDRYTRMIAESLAGGRKVMVNCWQGASRSATIVLAYLVQYQDMPLEEAVKMVKRKRDIRPNNVFLQDLIEFEAKFQLT